MLHAYLASTENDLEMPKAMNFTTNSKKLTALQDHRACEGTACI